MRQHHKRNGFIEGSPKTTILVGRTHCLCTEMKISGSTCVREPLVACRIVGSGASAVKR